ncbi:reverse transcriptase domain-containing protein [Tanacetum coccineum]
MAPKRATRSTRVPPVTPAPNATTTTVTEAQLQALINQGVAAAMAEAEASRVRNGYDSNGSGPRPAQAARECSYSEFLKCKPLDFKGTEGVVGLTRWFEKMESVFSISNCTATSQVKFATCTLQDDALTWWNAHVKTTTPEAAHAMPWAALKKMMTDKYCPRGKIKKIETEMWNLKVKGTDVVAYNRRFQQLALMCARMFPEEVDKIEKYIGGLPDMILGSVMASKPKTMQEVIEFTTELMEDKTHAYVERQAESPDIGRKTPAKCLIFKLFAAINFDYGANQHWTYTDKDLVNVIDISYLKIKVSHPSGTKDFIAKVGNLVLTNFLTLYDVLVVPEYCVSLVSVHKVARDTKFIVAFDESKCFVLSQDLMDVKVMGIGPYMVCTKFWLILEGIEDFNSYTANASKEGMGAVLCKGKREGKCRSDALSRKNGKPPQKARKQKTTRVRMLEYLSENLNIPEAIRTEQFWNLPPFRTSGSTMPQWQVSEKMYQRRKGSILGGPIWK